MFTKINTYLRNNKGQTMVEFAIVAPIFFLIFIIGPIQLGLLMNYQMGISSATIQGARDASISLKTDISGVKKTGRESAIHYIENIMQWEEVKRKKVTGSNYTGTKKGCETYYKPVKAGEVNNGDTIRVKCSYDVPLIFGLQSITDDYVNVIHVAETSKEDF